MYEWVYGCMDVWVYRCMGKRRACLHGTLVAHAFYALRNPTVFSSNSDYMYVGVYVCTGVSVYACMRVPVYRCVRVWVLGKEAQMSTRDARFTCCFPLRMPAALQSDPASAYMYYSVLVFLNIIKNTFLCYHSYSLLLSRETLLFNP